MQLHALAYFSGFKEAHLEGVKEFAEMLLDFYNRRKEERDEVKAASDELFQQALGNEEYFRIFLISNCN